MTYLPPRQRSFRAEVRELSRLRLLEKCVEIVAAVPLPASQVR